MMRTSMAVAAVAALLAACGTPQERTAYREDPIGAMAAEYGPRCDRLGHPRDSREWRDCIGRLSRHDELVRHSLHYDRYMSWYWLR